VLQNSRKLEKNGRLERRRSAYVMPTAEHALHTPPFNVVSLIVSLLRIKFTRATVAGPPFPP
jgi:hypothetical protein